MRRYQQDHAARDAEFECFRLPTDMKEGTFKGNKMTAGSYVFIENKECDKLERTASFMQQQYHVVDKKASIPSAMFKEQYAEIIGE